jgi:hypothetical protein
MTSATSTIVIHVPLIPPMITDTKQDIVLNSVRCVVCGTDLGARNLLRNSCSELQQTETTLPLRPLLRSGKGINSVDCFVGTRIFWLFAAVELYDCAQSHYMWSVVVCERYVHGGTWCTSTEKSIRIAVAGTGSGRQS